MYTRSLLQYKEDYMKHIIDAIGPFLIDAIPGIFFIVFLFGIVFGGPLGDILNVVSIWMFG